MALISVSSAGSTLKSNVAFLAPRLKDTPSNAPCMKYATTTTHNAMMGMVMLEAALPKAHRSATPITKEIKMLALIVPEWRALSYRSGTRARAGNT
mmetsp:Transcript_13694/g.34427  ORF Transcript_13694/g.34427 Transcript_13694/m.34427 type:complete len:96 (+) Transcript_13694:61-348(+)